MDDKAGAFSQSEELGHLFYPDCRTPEPSLSCIITKKVLYESRTCTWENMHALFQSNQMLFMFYLFVCLFLLFFYWSSELFKLRVTLDRSSNHRSSSLEGTLEYPRDESKATHEASS